jgi:hypothetical protein
MFALLIIGVALSVICAIAAALIAGARSKG